MKPLLPTTIVLLLTINPADSKQQSPADLKQLSQTYLQSDRYQAAIPLLETLTSTLKTTQTPQEQAQNLSNLGIAYQNLGRYPQALKAHKSASLAFHKLGDRPAFGQAILNLANTFEALGDYEKTLLLYNQSLTISRQFQDQPGEAITLTNLAAVQFKLGQDKIAIDHLKTSLRLYQSLQDPLGQAQAQATLGSIHQGNQRPTEARAAYKAALDIAKQLRNTKLEAEILSQLAILYEDQNQLQEALLTHENSRTLAKTLDDPELNAMVLNNQGHSLLAAGKFTEAEQRLRSAIDLLDRLRPGLTDTYKVSIFDTQLFTYNLLQQVLIAAKQPEAALEVSEQGRARAFAERLTQRIGKTPTLPPITLAEIRKVAKRQNTTIVEYAIVPDDAFKFRGKQRGKEQTLLIWVVQPNGKITLRQVDLKQRWEKQGTLKQIVATARCLGAAPVCPTVEEVAQTRGFSIGTVQPKKTDKPTKIEKIDPNTFAGLPELYEILIAPIQDLLPKSAADRVTFIPQESLFLVPFAILPNPQGQYLIQDHTLSSSPSIQSLTLLAAKAQFQTTTNLVLGNPSPMPLGLTNLPFSEEEALAVAQELKTIPLIGPQATKANLLRQLPQAKIIHLATHGLLTQGQVDNLDAPGAIALAPRMGKNDPDGFLTAQEIINLDLSADLVVLSACDTGRGEITGDGVLGLSRSWLAAGSKNIIVSLWAVNDRSTSHLMTQFYQNLKTQPDKAIALRSAMLSTMKKHPQPKDWGAFTLIGN